MIVGYFHLVCRHMGTLGSQVMCDNIPGLVSKQRQLCRQHPKIMQAIGVGVKEWLGECQHQFQNHRWNCNTLARDHNVFGKLLHRSKYDEGTVCLFDRFVCVAGKFIRSCLN